MAIINHAVTFDGVSSFLDLGGNQITWNSQYLPFVGFSEPNLADQTTVDISLSGVWEITALFFDTVDFTDLTDVGFADGHIEYLQLGSNSTVTLNGTYVRFLATGHGGTHTISLGDSPADILELRGDTNSLTTNGRYVGAVYSTGDDTISVGSGGMGYLNVGDRDDVVTVAGRIDALVMGTGNDVLNVDPGGRVNAVQFQEGKNTLALTGTGRVDFAKFSDGGNSNVNKITGQDDGRVDFVKINDSGDFRVTLTDNGRIATMIANDSTMTMNLSGNAKVQNYRTYNTDNTLTLKGSAKVDLLKMDDSTNSVKTGKGHVESIATYDSANTFKIGTGGTGQIQIVSARKTKQVVDAVGHIGQLIVSDNQKTTLTLGDGGAGSVQLGGGNDQVTTGKGFADFIDTAAGKDVVQIGAGGANTVRTRNGTDTVTTTTQFVTFIDTGDDADTVRIGSGGASAVRTGSGDDTVTLSDGFVSSLDTSDGNDVVHAGTRGIDRVRLGNGDDVIYLQEITPNEGLSILGSGGKDTADFGFFSVGIIFTLDGLGVFQNVGAPGGDPSVDAVGFFSETGVENVAGTGQNDDLTGDSGANVLQGRGGKDTLVGLDGNDTLDGGKAADTLDGGKGRDILIGGGGNDVLTGGGKPDTFVFGKKSGKDRITDFQDGSDILEIANHKGGFKKLAIADAGNDLEIVHDGGTITLEGMAGTKLTKADFDFV